MASNTKDVKTVADKNEDSTACKVQIPEDAQTPLVHDSSTPFFGSSENEILKEATFLSTKLDSKKTNPDDKETSEIVEDCASNIQAQKNFDAEFNNIFSLSCMDTNKPSTLKSGCSKDIMELDVGHNVEIHNSTKKAHVNKKVSDKSKTAKVKNEYLPPKTVVLRPLIIKVNEISKCEPRGRKFQVKYSNRGKNHGTTFQTLLNSFSDCYEDLYPFRLNTKKLPTEEQLKMMEAEASIEPNFPCNMAIAKRTGNIGKENEKSKLNERLAMNFLKLGRLRAERYSCCKSIEYKHNKNFQANNHVFTSGKFLNTSDITKIVVEFLRSEIKSKTNYYNVVTNAEVSNYDDLIDNRNVQSELFSEKTTVWGSNNDTEVHSHKETEIVDFIKDSSNEVQFVDQEISKSAESEKQICSGNNTTDVCNNNYNVTNQGIQNIKIPYLINVATDVIENKIRSSLKGVGEEFKEVSVPLECTAKSTRNLVTTEIATVSPISDGSTVDALVKEICSQPNDNYSQISQEDDLTLCSDVNPTTSSKKDDCVDLKQCVSTLLDEIKEVSSLEDSKNNILKNYLKINIEHEFSESDSECKSDSNEFQSNSFKIDNKLLCNLCSGRESDTVLTTSASKLETDPEMENSSSAASNKDACDGSLSTVSNLKPWSKKSKNTKSKGKKKKR